MYHVNYALCRPLRRTVKERPLTSDPAVSQDSYCLKARHTLLGHMDGPQGFGLCHLSWSPDSRYLLAAHESPEARVSGD